MSTEPSQVEALSRNKSYGKITSAEIMEILYRQKKYDVALIKLFDRKHNLQTLGVKSPEKVKKIIKEIMEEFIIVAMHLKIPAIPQNLVALCYENLSIPQFVQHNLYQTFVDNSRLLSPIFQNDINPL